MSEKDINELEEKEELKQPENDGNDKPYQVVIWNNHKHDAHDSGNNDKH